MLPIDKEKMALITGQSNYCYKVMSFGMKNVNASYQRLMDKTLVNLIRCNVKSYIDDMIVKSRRFLITQPISEKFSIH